MRIDWNMLNSPILKTVRYDIIPFHSYYFIALGRIEYIQEVICNLLVLLPFGVCITILHKKVTVKKVMTVCMCLSFAIETLQLFYGCGLFETDDLIHNTLGGVGGTSCIEVFPLMLIGVVQ